MLRIVEDLLHERGIGISQETVRYWWDRFGPLFADDIRRQWASCMCRYRQWQWDLDETLQKFASVHANVHNHFNSERHLIVRPTYKLLRSAALAEWRSLMA